MASLAGRTALISGGGRGIGLAIGKQLASRGCNVVVAAKVRSDGERVWRARSKRGFYLASRAL